MMYRILDFIAFPFVCAFMVVFIIVQTIVLISMCIYWTIRYGKKEANDRLEVVKQKVIKKYMNGDH